MPRMLQCGKYTQSFENVQHKKFQAKNERHTDSIVLINARSDTGNAIQIFVRGIDTNDNTGRRMSISFAIHCCRQIELPTNE